MKKKLLLILTLSLTLVSCQKPVNEVVKDDTVEIIQEQNETTTTVGEETQTPLVEEVLHINPLPLSKLVDGVEKWGYVNDHDLSDVLIDYIYDDASFFNESLDFAIVSQKETVGVIDTNGTYLIPMGTYKTINFAKSDVLYGTTNENQPIIFDFKGSVIYTATPGTFIYNQNGILEIQESDKSSYLDPITKQIIKIPEMDYAQKEMFLKTVDKSIDVKQNSETQKYTISRGGTVLSETGYDYVLPLDDFIIVGTSKEDLQAPHLGVLDSKGHILIDRLYYDILHVTGNYFAVAEYSDYDMNFKIYSNKVYKKAIFNRTEAVTGFDYYIIEYVKDDIFYVYDGNSYYFLDVSTHKKVDGLNLEGPLKFRNVGEILIASHDSYDGKIIMYIKDWKVVKRVSNSYYLKDGIVISKFKSAGINPVFYPLVALGDAEVEKKINQDLKLQFDTNIPLADEKTGIYADISNVGFKVEESRQVLHITQNYYWYGLGAAHGNYGEVTFLYDLTTGDRVRMADLFKEGVDYHSIIARALSELSKDDDRLYADQASLTDDERLEYFRRDSYNFRLLDQGISIYYNPYDIGPYVAGIIEFTIPYETFSEVLDKTKVWMQSN